MPNKTSQLQIRITPQQKVELKALAADAGLNVSQYVLATVLPSERFEVADRTEALKSGEDRSTGLEQLGEYLAGLDPSDLPRAVGRVDLDGTPPVLRNYVAALVELVTRSAGLEPPGWVQDVEPLENPHFGRALASLRPHQIRVTPVPFKRRNVFLDTEGTPIVQSGRRLVRPGAHFAEAGAWLVGLNAELRRSGIRAELVTVAGQVTPIAYAADPPTRNVTALFRPTSELRAALDAATRRTGDGDTWLTELAEQSREHDGKPSAPFVELSNVRLFPGRPEYVLAACCASLRTGRDGPTERNLAFLARHLGLTGPTEVLEVVGRYFTPRQLPAELPSVLDELLRGAVRV